MSTPQHHLQNAVEALAGSAADKIGYAVAGGMISAPLWRDELHDWAGVATDVAPFLGCAYLVAQIAVKLLDARRKLRETREEGKRPIVTAFNVSANISKLMSLLSSVTTSFLGMHNDAAGDFRWG